MTALGKAALQRGTYQQARTNDGDHDEYNHSQRCADVVATGRGRTPGDDADKNCCARQASTDHVGARLLWLASEPGEQKGQEHN